MSEAPPPREASEEGPLDRFRELPWPVRVGSVLALLALVGMVGYLAFGAGDEQPVPAPSPSPLVGLACPDLEDAARAHQAEDEEAFERAVDAAAATAERTLQTSGQRFGDPERAALELQHAFRDEGLNGNGVARWLEEARSACTALDRWDADAEPTPGTS